MLLTCAGNQSPLADAPKPTTSESTEALGVESCASATSVAWETDVEQSESATSLAFETVVEKDNFNKQSFDYVESTVDLSRNLSCPPKSSASTPTNRRKSSLNKQSLDGIKTRVDVSDNQSCPQISNNSTPTSRRKSSLYKQSLDNVESRVDISNNQSCPPKSNISTPANKRKSSFNKQSSDEVENNVNISSSQSCPQKSNTLTPTNRRRSSRISFLVEKDPMQAGRSSEPFGGHPSPNQSGEASRNSAPTDLRKMAITQASKLCKNTVVVGEGSLDRWAFDVNSVPDKVSLTNRKGRCSQAFTPTTQNQTSTLTSEAGSDPLAGRKKSRRQSVTVTPRLSAESPGLQDTNEVRKGRRRTMAVTPSCKLDSSPKTEKLTPNPGLQNTNDVRKGRRRTMAVTPSCRLDSSPKTEKLTPNPGVQNTNEVRKGRRRTLAVTPSCRQESSPVTEKLTPTSSQRVKKSSRRSFTLTQSSSSVSLSSQTSLKTWDTTGSKQEGKKMLLSVTQEFPMFSPTARENTNKSKKVVVNTENRFSLHVDAMFPSQAKALLKVPKKASGSSVKENNLLGREAAVISSNSRKRIATNPNISGELSSGSEQRHSESKIARVKKPSHRRRKQNKKTKMPQNSSSDEAEDEDEDESKGEDSDSSRSTKDVSASASTLFSPGSSATGRWMPPRHSIAGMFLFKILKNMCDTSRGKGGLRANK